MEKAAAKKTPAAEGRPIAGQRSSGPDIHPLLALQSTAGNQAVQHLLSKRLADTRRSEDSRNKVNRRNPGRVANRDTSDTLQLGALNDPQEVDADRVANSIMNERNTSATRHRAEGGKIEADKASRVQRVGAFGAASGRALDPASRAFFEPHFGNLAHVRIHDDEATSATAASIGARSYTAGSEIGFAHGKFAPHTGEGRKLLAHELAHVAQGGRIVRRQPDVEGGKQADQRVRRRVTRSDIASRGAPKADWNAQFAPQRPPVDPVKVDSIAQAQAWVTDLGGFTLDEKRRFKIGSHLKSMIEHLPPEVWLPSNEVISRNTTKKESLIVTGVRDPIDTANLRNKLYTMYLSINHPAELTKPRDPTGLIWDYDIEQFVTADEQSAAEKYGLSPDPKPYELNIGALTEREVAALDFLFPEEMLEWRRRDVEVQESVERELDRRTGVFMAALGEGSIKAIGQFFKYSALAGTGMAAAPVVSTQLGSALGVESIGAASWGTRALIATGTGEVIGAGTGAVDSAISNLPDVVTGDISVGDYFSGIGHSTWSGAKWGGVSGLAGHVASPFLNKIWNLISPGSQPTPPSTPKASTPRPPAPAVQPRATTPLPEANVPAPPVVEPNIPAVEPNISARPFEVPRTGWVRTRAREILMKAKLGFAGADVVPDMQIGYSRGPNASLIDKATGSGRVPGTPAPSQGSVASVADEAIAATPKPAASTATPQPPAQVSTPAAVANSTPFQGITLGRRPILINPGGPTAIWALGNDPAVAAPSQTNPTQEPQAIRSPDTGVANAEGPVSPAPKGTGVAAQPATPSPPASTKKPVPVSRSIAPKVEVQRQAAALNGVDARKQLEILLLQMMDKKIAPADLGYLAPEWEQLRHDYDANPIRALKELSGRLDRIGLLNEQIAERGSFIALSARDQEILELLTLRKTSVATEAARLGTEVHEVLAAERRLSGQWDVVDAPMYLNNQPVQVWSRFDASGNPDPRGRLRTPEPDAVNYSLRIVLDDKPLGRPPLADRDELLGNILAFEIVTGTAPRWVAIQYYDPETREVVKTVLFDPDFFR